MSSKQKHPKDIDKCKQGDPDILDEDGWVGVDLGRSFEEQEQYCRDPPSPSHLSHAEHSHTATAKILDGDVLTLAATNAASGAGPGTGTAIAPKDCQLDQVTREGQNFR